MRQVRAERKNVIELQPNSRYRLFQMSNIFMVVLANAKEIAGCIQTELRRHTVILT